MKQLETFVLTSAEAALRGLHPISIDATEFAACASASGEIVLHQFFNNSMSAAMWALEKSVWEYHE